MDSRTPPEQSLPSTTAIAVATAILAGLSGYFIGQASSIGLFSSTTSSHQKAKAAAPRKSWPNSYDVQVHPDSSDEELMTHLRGSKRNDRRTPKEIADSEEDEEESEHGKEDAEDVNEDLKSFEDNREECKLVLCVRTDLGMSKGKLTLANYMHFLGLSWIWHQLNTHFRQDSSPGFTRHPCKLYCAPFTLSASFPTPSHPTPLAASGPGQNRSSSPGWGISVRRAPSDCFIVGTLCVHDPRCR